MVGEGAFFPNTITAAPYTTAAHATLFSGRWPHRHRVYEFFNRRLRGDTVFTWARERGMRTYFKSDFPLILSEHLGFLDDVTDYIVEDDEKYLADLDTSGPTMSFLHFGSVHVPYGFHNLKFGGDDYRKKVAELTKEIDLAGPAVGDYLLWTPLDDADRELVLAYKQIISHYYEKGDYATLMSLYLEGVDRFMRTRFEPFMERVLDRFRGQRVLVVVFGDHGEEYDADSYGHFNSVSEGVARVPVLFWGTDVTAGLHETRVRTVDVAPTLAECLGVGDPLDGTSLSGTVFGREAPEPRTAFCQAWVADTVSFVDYQREMIASGRRPGHLPHVCFAEAVYDGDYKLSRHNQTDAGGNTGTWSPIVPIEPRITLERVGADLVPRPVEDEAVARRLLSLLDDYRARVEADGAAPAADDPQVTDRMREQFRDMGYDI